MNNANKDALMAVAKELEIELFDADFEQPSVLTDDELDAVAGGGRCICSFGGGGEYKDGTVRCVCIIGGDGNW